MKRKREIGVFTDTSTGREIVLYNVSEIGSGKASYIVEQIDQYSSIETGFERLTDALDLFDTLVRDCLV